MLNFFLKGYVMLSLKVYRIACRLSRSGRILTYVPKLCNDAGLLYPRGPQLFVCVANVAVFLEEFLSLTCKQLARLCSAHGLGRAFLSTPKAVGRCTMIILEFRLRKRARRDIYSKRVSLGSALSWLGDRQLQLQQDPRTHQSIRKKCSHL